MSEKHCINYGYVVPVLVLRQVMTPANQLKLDELLEENGDNMSGLDDELMSLLPTGFPRFAGIFTPREEDVTDGQLSEGYAYVWYEEDALFDLVPKTPWQQLTDGGVIPAFSAWAIWA